MCPMETRTHWRYHGSQQSCEIKMASIPNAVPDRTKLPKLAVLLHPSTANSLKFLFQVWDSAVEGGVVVVEVVEEEEEQETEEEESLVGVFKTC